VNAFPTKQKQTRKPHDTRASPTVRIGWPVAFRGMSQVAGVEKESFLSERRPHDADLIDDNSQVAFQYRNQVYFSIAISAPIIFVVLPYSSVSHRLLCFYFVYSISNLKYVRLRFPRLEELKTRGTHDLDVGDDTKRSMNMICRS
jgi:hypothetical protein